MHADHLRAALAAVAVIERKVQMLLGIVPGSTPLIGGEPGIGKSKLLLLQVSA